MTAVKTSENVIPENLQEKLEKNLFRHSKAPYGYKLVDGKYATVPEQVKTVKEIFSMVLSGNGTSLIARELNRRKIPTETLKKDGTTGSWSTAMVQGIISNEFYTGDILKYKYALTENYSEDPENEALAPFLVRDHHEAIVDRETFLLANSVNRQFGMEKGRIRKKMNPIEKKTVFSGKLRCGLCGASMKRVTQQTSVGTVFHWACTCHLRDKNACPMKRVREETVKNAFITLANKLSYLRGDSDLPSNSIPGFHHLEDFDETLFQNTVTSADVITGEKIVFHLECDLTLTETIVSAKSKHT